MAQEGRVRLSHARDEWLTMSERRGFAASTVRSRRSITGRFASSIGDDVYLHNVTVRHVERFVDAYDHDATANIALSVLSVFFRWCYRRGMIRVSPCDPIDPRRLKQDSLRKTRVPPDEWPMLLDTAERRHPRDRMLVALGLYTAQRSSEYSRVRLSDIECDDNGMAQYIVVERPKVRDVRRIPVFAELADEIEHWLDWYRSKCADRFGNLPPNAYLLPARLKGHFVRGADGRVTNADSDRMVNPHKPVSSQTMLITVRTVLQDVGYWRRGDGTHTLRRSMARALYDEEVDNGHDGAMETVQKLLGHKSMLTTQGYLGIDVGDKRLSDRVAGKPFRRNKPTQAGRPGKVIPLVGRYRG